MVKKKIICVSSLIIIGFTLIVFVPIQLISFKFFSYGMIDESISYIYEPSSPSPIEKLYINVDEGDVQIKYINPPVDYYALIDVNIVMNGVKLAGKSYEDYLNISWNKSSSPANFTIEIISDDWFNPSLWLFKEVNIVVTLRKDMVFDIITNLTEGNFEIAVPWAVSIGNLITNVSNGDISYDFEHSTIQGNITCNINEGDLIFKSCDVEYAHNNSWDINVGKGNVNLEIYQYREMDANITGKVKVNDGEVFIIYKDNTANIGAILEIPYGDSFMSRGGLPGCIKNIYNFTCTEVNGFDYNHIDSESVMGTVYFTSFDLLSNIVKNYYSMRFEIIQGSFDMSLSSDPLFK